MKNTRLGLLVAVGLLAVGIPAVSLPLVAGASPSTPHDFVAHLSAAPGVSTQATGEATFRLSPDGQSLSYRLVVSNVDNVFMAHIHLSPSMDIVVWLYPNPNTVPSGGEAACVDVLSGTGPVSACPGYKAGRFDGLLAEGTITLADLSGSTTCNACSGLSPPAFSTLISDIEAGQTFVNVHTTQDPAGEIQGTISSSPPPPPAPHPPHFQVVVTTNRPSVSGDGFDAILYVSVPHQKPSGSFNSVRYDLTQSFVLQSIGLTQVAPNGTRTPSTLISCTLSTSPAYPSRNTVPTCTGTFASRVMPFVYPGSNTGVYFSGFGPDSTGRWTYVFSVTGLYNGAPITLTSQVSVDAQP